MYFKKFFGKRYKDEENKHVEQFLDKMKTKRKFHRFVIIGLSKEDNIEVKAHFVFPIIKSKEKDQHIFVSKDYSKLIEFYDDEVYVYKIDKPTTENTASEIEY